MNNLARAVFILSSVFILTLVYVVAQATDPAGPASITIQNSSSFNATAYEPTQINALAGNITYLTIDAITQTQSWQGYYGQVSGNITLQDGNNNTFYSWTLTEPQGEIYASNGSAVTWANIACVNYTNNGSDDGATNYNFNLTDLENMYGMDPADADGVNETFFESGQVTSAYDSRDTSHPTVYVGTYTITSGSCPATDTYESGAADGTEFNEILLTDNTSIIFTTLIESDIANEKNDTTGYDGANHDFQMLVGEDGHDGDESTTPYFFYVELE